MNKKTFNIKLRQNISSKNIDKNNIIISRNISFYEKSEEILRGYARKVLVGIVILSIIIKGLYFYQAAQITPIFKFHEWDQCDMNFFNLWAEKVSKGDLLLENPLHPNHIWEIKTANYYFENNPEKYAEYLQKNNGIKDSIALSQLLWNHWFQEKTYQQEPLYAYVIALIYKIFGQDVRWVFIFQMLLGIGINVLILKIGTYYFGHLSGFISALLVTFCGPILVYDLVLIRSTLTVFLTLLTLYSHLKALDKKSFVAYFSFGIISCIAYLNQSYTLLFFVIGLLILFYNHPSVFKQKMVLIATSILGFSIMLSPLIYRNYKVGAPLMSVAGHGAVVFITGNQKSVEPTQIFVVDSSLTSTILAKTDAKMLPSIVESIKSHDSLWDYLGLMIGKFFAIFHWVEIHNNINYYFYQQLTPILKWTCVTNFIIAPFGLVGLFLAFKQYRFKLMPLYVMFFVCFFPMLIGLVFGRFRVNLLVILILLSGFLMSELIKMYSEKNKKIKMWICVLLLTFFITSNGRITKFSPVQAWEYELVYNQFYLNDIKQFALENKPEKCLELIDSYLSFEPSFLKNLNSIQKTNDIEEKYIAYFFINIFEMKGKILRGMKRQEEAVSSETKALDLKLSLTN
jgi:4-amino-4-deoxy-L-arabinose transferase-like glycosyltransferase